MDAGAVKLEAIIFDVDGTLAETEEAHRQAFNDAFKEFGIDWTWSQADYKELLKTTGGKERIRAHMDAIGFQYDSADPVDEFVKRLHARKTEIYTAAIEKGAVDLRPGVRELIEECRASGMTMAIATTTSYPNVVALIEATLGAGAMELFPVVSSGDIVRKKKPAPDIFVKAIEDLGLAAGRCIALEDSANGLKSALGAGVATLITPSIYTHDDDFAGASKITPTLADLAGGDSILAAVANCHAQAQA